MSDRYFEEVVLFFFVGLLPFEMFDEDERIHFLMMSISVVLRKMNLLVDEYQG